MMGALDDIAAERARQIDAEGWTLAHDDLHGGGEMAMAAAAYAYGTALSDLRRQSVSGSYSIRNNRMLSDMWPWTLSWWKPKDRRRDLVRAGALIVAEIERLDRLAAAVPQRGAADV
jgi:hypothetical protein